ncbi:MAG: hypothetical protein M3M94_03985, partial [Actinomycetota bacterium]|nr:hypothetical protein [Actinomycetota bacterium]
MSARLRMAAIVGVVAAAAAGTAVGATLLTGSDDARRTAPRPRSGHPPLVLELGVRDDREARLLRRAARLYADGEHVSAQRLFVRSRSPEAEVGAALSAWPEGTIAELERLRASYPRSGAVHVNLGVALYWAGRDREAVAAWRAAERSDPDSPYAVRADDFL